MNLAKELNDKEKAKAIANICQAENKCHSWARLSSLQSCGVRQQQIYQVLIPDDWPDADIEDEEKIELSVPKKFDKKWKNDLSKWKTIKVPTEIEFYLRLRNQRHFGQAKSYGTPFTTDRLKAKFNWSASTTEAELVLAGEYSDDGLTNVQQLFLNKMKRVTEPDLFPWKITKKHIQSKDEKVA